jgi:hypothetical protein
MLQVVFWLAVACGVISAATGNRTAWVLLASVGLCFAFGELRIPFNFIIWVLIDLAVILAIIRPTMTKADCIILALFVPAWCFYLLPPDPRFWGSFVVVVAQLVFTFPVEALRAALAGLWVQSGDPPFDRLVAHA